MDFIVIGANKSDGDINFNIATFVDFNQQRFLIKAKMTKSFETSIENADSFVKNKLKTLEMKTLYLSKSIEYKCIGQNYLSGPSSGTMLALMLMSLALEIPITNGNELALTGAMDADGEIRGVGGIKQKINACVASGIKTIFVPSENYEEVKLLNISKFTMQVVSCSSMNQILNIVWPHIFPN